MWLTLLEVALKIVGWFLDKNKASDETKKMFFEFAKKAGNDFGSVRLMEWGDKQLKWLSENPWIETK